jgi:glycosyltransferase involved in cell wall biosynthesis
MRIGWATPFNTQSAVGRHALEVVLEMRRRGVDVEIIRTDLGEAARLAAWPDAVPVRTLDGAGIDDLRQQFDLLVVTLADQLELNSGSLTILRSIPSVGIFHGADLAHPGEGLARAGVGLDLVGRLRRIGATSGSTEPDSANLSWIAALCIGAVVHSRHDLEPVKAHCPGPAVVIPPCIPDPGRSPARRSERAFTIMTLGDSSANQQVDRVMRAIAQSPALKDRAVYRLVGAIAAEERERIVSLAGELGVQAPQFHDRLTDGDLHTTLGEAHAICCLEHSVPLGASPALIVALYSGTPVIVADTGAAAEVPDELAWRVSDGTEIDDVARALVSIAENQREADTRAVAARDWACRTHAVPAYVDKLMPLLEESLEIAPMIVAGRQLGATLHAIGAGLDEPAAGRFGDILQELFTARREGRE